MVELAALYRDSPTYTATWLRPLQLPLTTGKAIFRGNDVHVSSGAGSRLSPPIDGNVVK